MLCVWLDHEATNNRDPPGPTSWNCLRTQLELYIFINMLWIATVYRCELTSGSSFGEVPSFTLTGLFLATLNAGGLLVPWISEVATSRNLSCSAKLVLDVPCEEVFGCLWGLVGPKDFDITKLSDHSVRYSVRESSIFGYQDNPNTSAYYNLCIIGSFTTIGIRSGI